MINFFRENCQYILKYEKSNRANPFKNIKGFDGRASFFFFGTYCSMHASCMFVFAVKSSSTFEEVKKRGYTDNMYYSPQRNIFQTKTLRLSSIKALISYLSCIPLWIFLWDELHKGKYFITCVAYIITIISCLLYL